MEAVNARGSWAALDLTARTPLLSGTARVLESCDPATGEVVARVATSTLEDVDAAVSAAAAAFESSTWQHDATRRAHCLAQYAGSLRDNAQYLAELLTREQGKTLNESLIEVESAADFAEYYSGLCRLVLGKSTVVGELVTALELREPVGVAAVITPWNWPLQLLLRSLAPALAAGNTCVVKPASLTPAVSIECVRLFQELPDVPPGVVTVVAGSGTSVGEALVAHPAVSMIAFTGESRTGTQVMQRAAERLRKVTLELGGKSPNIIFADANLDKAFDGAKNAILTTAGQICTAGSRLLLEEPIYDEFVHRLVGAFEATVVGDPLAPATQMGPLVSEHQRESVLSYVQQAHRAGRVLVGGERLDGGAYSPGHYISPAVVADLPRSSPVLCEEIFGPVVAVQRFTGTDEAIALANDTEYGLAAAIWTDDLNRALRVSRAITAGTVWVNTYNHFYPELEVGGRKRSGIGREQGVEGMLEFTEMKHINLDASPTLW